MGVKATGPAVCKVVSAATQLRKGSQTRPLQPTPDCTASLLTGSPRFGAKKREPNPKLTKLAAVQFGQAAEKPSRRVHPACVLIALTTSDSGPFCKETRICRLPQRGRGLLPPPSLARGGAQPPAPPRCNGSLFSGGRPFGSRNAALLSWRSHANGSPEERR